MIDSTPAPSDVRDLLGMRTTGALYVIGAYVVAMTIVVVYQVPVVTSVPPLFAGLVMFCIASVIVVRVGDDPLSPTISAALIAAAVLGCVLVFSVTPAIPLSSLLFTWTHGAAAAVFCYMNVRGRFIAPWIGLALVIALAAFWASFQRLSPVTAALLVAVDAAPMTMALLFSLTLRPTARLVFSLRAQITERVAQTSADEAASDERSRQTTRLNDLARPLLERIASGHELSAPERVDCEALEAHLRDQLRAPLLTRLGLDVDAFHARRRGVAVVMIDDTMASPDETLAALNPEVVTALQRLAEKTLTEATGGDVFVRISAPGSRIAASVLSRPDDSASSARSEIASDGTVRVFN